MSRTGGAASAVRQRFYNRVSMTWPVMLARLRIYLSGSNVMLVSAENFL